MERNRPDHIIVYDFAAIPADVSADSAIAGQTTGHATSQTAEQIATGRQVGAEIAQVLVEDIRGMGLSAEQASNQTSPQIGDLMIKGSLLSIDEGSAAKCVAIGSGTADTGGSKSPGAALGVAGAVATDNPAELIISTGMKVYREESGSSTTEGRAKDMAKEIADKRQVKFKEQGWIQSGKHCRDV